ncbi:hypothetical protein [Novosphingobium panipatense]|uniref:hypothetical protein n=1 Tax=Novosphingobium panipatense TaxID=428991 RepID=UPI00361A1BCF
MINASQTARDITARKQTETLLAQQSERLQTLYRVASEISRDLDLDRIVQSVTDIGTELSGAKFGAFFYNVTNAAGNPTSSIPFRAQHERLSILECLGTPQFSLLPSQVKA